MTCHWQCKQINHQIASRDTVPFESRLLIVSLLIFFSRSSNFAVNISINYNVQLFAILLTVLTCRYINENPIGPKLTADTFTGLKMMRYL